MILIKNLFMNIEKQEESENVLEDLFSALKKIYKEFGGEDVEKGQAEEGTDERDKSK